MINANDAARMVIEYQRERERKMKEEIDAIFPEVMAAINDEIISSASIGRGDCRIDLKRLSGYTDLKSLRYIGDKVETELSKTLGYRVVAFTVGSIDIIWLTDVQ